MADLEERRISDLTRALEVDSSALFEMSVPDDGAESGYSSYATDVETMAQKMLGGINFETQLQTKAKNIFGAINEANQHGGGGGGSDVAMSDNPNGGVDLDVEGTTRTLAKQETIDGVVAIEENEEVDEIDILEPSDLDGINNNISKMLTNFSVTMRLKIYEFKWNSSYTIDVPSEPCFLFGNRGSGSSEKGFMIYFNGNSNEYMVIKNSANISITNWNPSTKKISITLGSGAGSNIYAFCAYWTSLN